MSARRTLSRPARGFTLVELMFAVAVVGILVALAYAPFMQQIAKSRRGDARSALLVCAQALERYNTLKGSYAAASDTDVAAACLGATRNRHYVLADDNVPTTAGTSTYVIRAAPTGAQRGDACGTFTYAHDGSKGVAGASLPGTSCW